MQTPYKQNKDKCHVVLRKFILNRLQESPKKRKLLLQHNNTTKTHPVSGASWRGWQWQTWPGSGHCAGDCWRPLWWTHSEGGSAAQPSSGLRHSEAVPEQPGQWWARASPSATASSSTEFIRREYDQYHQSRRH